MAETIDDLFQSQPLIEISEISNEQRDHIVEEAEKIIFDLTERNFDGGVLSDLYKNMIRSFIELYARKEAIDRTGRCLIIDVSVYESAAKEVQILLENNSYNIDGLQSLWLNKAIFFLQNIFIKSKKIFEPYIVGELCENLYINNEGSILVINELIDRNILQVDGYKYGHNLISLNK